jgi:hypothetical protein
MMDDKPQAQMPTDSEQARLVAWDGLTGAAPAGEVYAITTEPHETHPGLLRHTIECISARSASVTLGSTPDTTGMVMEDLKDEAEPWAAANMILAGREIEMTADQIEAGLTYLREDTAEGIEILEGRVPLGAKRTPEEFELRMAEIANEVAVGRAALARHGCHV